MNLYLFVVPIVPLGRWRGRWWWLWMWVMRPRVWRAALTPGHFTYTPGGKRVWRWAWPVSPIGFEVASP